MIYNSDIKYVRSLLDAKGINNSILKLHGKYYDAFIDVICWTYRNTDSEIWVNSRFQRIGNYYLKLFVAILGAFLSWLKYLFNHHKYFSKIKLSKNVAMPFCGDHIRFKYIYDFIGEDLNVIYPPLYHYTYVEEHISCFRNNGKKIEIGGFHLSDLLLALYTVIVNHCKIKNCHIKIDQYFEREYGGFVSVIFSSILYSRFIRRLLKRIPDDGEARRWFFDYDFDFKYIIFNNEIKAIRKNDTTFHVQHGAFLGYNDAYCNPVSDVSLCCSLREKSIIERANKYSSIIIPQGSSWQSIDKTEYAKEENTIKYDILILLTDTLDANLTSFQKKILVDLSGMKADVLARYRPQSANMDRVVLQDYVKNMDVSSGTSLKQDILSSRLVICFSEDAIFECFRNNKKVLFMTKDASCYVYDIASSDNMQIVTIESYNNEMVNRLLRCGECDYSKDQFVKYNFGDFMFEDVKKNMSNILKMF